MSGAWAVAEYSARFRFDQREWLAGQLAGCRELRSVVSAHWRRVADRDGVTVANESLRGIVGRLRVADFAAACDDSELSSFADTRARMCSRYANRSECAQEYAKRSAAVYGLTVPEKGAAARVACSRWWSRQLRRVSARRCEAVLRDIGRTNRGAGVYVSSFTFDRWARRQKRNRDLLESLVAENDAGQSFSLAELSDLGQSNPVLRRGELMVRMRGFEQWAEQDSREWVAMFYTVTCPSRFHAYLSKGGKNKKHDGSDPMAGQKYLVRLWSQIRAECARRSVPFFGFRVAEPHHDGTPHWHLLLMVEAGSEDDLTGIMRDYATRADYAVDGLNRPKAARARFDAVRIDAGRGSATGYIAKYVAKNIDGFAVGDDDEAQDFATNTAARVRAWASVWGIRQFQQIGGPPVTVWRELRRAANDAGRLPVDGGEQLTLALEAADSSDWCGFVGAMGGAVCPRVDRPLSVFYFTRDKAGAERVGQYGDAVRAVKGLLCRGLVFPIITRVREWVVKVASGAGGAVDFCPRSGPWSSVNNCTG